MSSDEAEKDRAPAGEIVERRIRLCVVVDEDGGHATRAFVSCAEQDDVSVSVGVCASCPRLRGITNDASGQPARMTCEVDGGAGSRSAADRAPLRALAQAPLHEALGREHLAVREDLAVDIAAAWLLEHRRHCVPVVDELERVVGIVTAADLLAVYRGEVAAGIVRARTFWWAGALLGVERASSITRVADVMRAPVSVRDTASIGLAALVMAREGIDALPVVASSGRLVGVVTSRDTLQWVAAAAGLHVPAIGET